MKTNSYLPTYQPNLIEENKMTQKAWSTPVLVNYGSASKITQNTVDFNKTVGSGDSIILSISGVDTVVNVPNGGSLINTTITP